MKNNRTKALLIVWLLVIVSFCTVHLTGDFKCFIAWARLTHQNDASGIASLSETWEMKGILLRAIFLALYNISSFFANDVTLEFQFIYKIFGAVSLNTILALAIYLFPSKYLGDKMNRKEWFLLSGIILFAVHFASHLQAEFIAVPILVLATSLYLRNDISSKILSGLLIGLTFFLKSPIPIMGGSVMFISMLYSRRSLGKEFVNILPLGISMLFTVGIGLWGLYISSPQEIQDILDASTFQSTLLSNPSAIKSSFGRIASAVVQNGWYNPGSGILLCLLSTYLLKLKNDRAFLYLVITTLFPCAYIMLSNCYFVYHCYLLMFPALFAILYFIKNDYDCIFSKCTKVFYTIVTIAALIINPCAYHIPSSTYPLCLLTLGLCCMVLIKKIQPYIYHLAVALLVFSYIVNGSSISASAIRSNIEYNRFLNETKIQNMSIGEPLGSESILYLDGGLGSFCLNNESYLRYFYPLPLQRVDESTSKFMETRTFAGVMEDVCAFNNQYITLDEKWFFHYSHPEVEKLLKEKYSKIQEVKLPSYSWSLFCYNHLEYSNIQIMQKKIIAE